jgi:hypothetical protein
MTTQIRMHNFNDDEAFININDLIIHLLLQSDTASQHDRVIYKKIIDMLVIKRDRAVRL